MSAIPRATLVIGFKFNVEVIRPPKSWSRVGRSPKPDVTVAKKLNTPDAAGVKDSERGVMMSICAVFTTLLSDNDVVCDTPNRVGFVVGVNVSDTTLVILPRLSCWMSGVNDIEAAIVENWLNMAVMTGVRAIEATDVTLSAVLINGVRLRVAALIIPLRACLTTGVKAMACAMAFVMVGIEMAGVKPNVLAIVAKNPNIALTAPVSARLNALVILEFCIVVGVRVSALLVVAPNAPFRATHVISQ